ncbi:MAG: molybdopterin-dependent oxidoreductase, partial [Deltaproteobacteria bacterium]|nr:molybdopterin-dependent oxidoreductase [Deltaproteobacteria bacterium]
GVLGGLGARGGMVHNPGFVDFRGMLARTKVAAGSVLGILPPADLADAILDDGPGRIRALLVVAADPLESLPSTAKVRRALERLETLVVLDVVPTATTALASVVLPCAHHLEKEDVHLLLPDRVPRRYTQLSRRVVSPPGVSRSEVAILADLASALGMPLFSPAAIDVAVRVASRLIRAGERPVSPEGALEVLLPLATRFSLTRRGARAPSAGVRPAALDPRWLASGIRRRGGRIDLAPARFVEALEQALRGEPSEPSAEGHDLVLTTCARDRGFVNGKTRAIGRAANGLVASLCAADAERRGLADGARGWLETAVGSAEVTVKLDPDVREGLVVVPFGSPGLNALTDDRDRDPLSGIPALANVPCRLTSSGTRTEGVEA